MSPLEKNARRLVGVLVQHFPTGGTSNELRRQFEADTSLVRQSYYDALRYAKQQGWFLGGEKAPGGRAFGEVRSRRDVYRLYTLNPDASWKEPPPKSVGELIGEMDKDQLEHLAGSQAGQIEELRGEVERLNDWSSGGVNGVAISNLAKIVGDNTASLRQRIKAAGAVLNYKVEDDTIVEFVRAFLERVCVSADNFDYRIEAGELLRRHEAPRVALKSIRPTYRENDGGEAARIEAWRAYEIAARELKIIQETKDVPPPGWDDDLRADSYVPPAEGWPGPAPEIPLKDLAVARRTRQVRMEREMAAAIERDLKAAEAQSRKRSRYNGNANGNGNGSDG